MEWGKQDESLLTLKKGNEGLQLDLGHLYDVKQSLQRVALAHHGLCGYRGLARDPRRRHLRDDGFSTGTDTHRLLDN